MDKILFVPHPKLRQQAKTIIKVTQSEIDLSKKMVDVMLSAPGVGLAANQIGILKKIDKTYVLFNPKIKSYSKKKIIMEEGCLSLPKQYADIERPKSITVEYVNEKNEIIKEKKNGFEARVLQHEIDHLEGKLFIDYLSSLKRNIFIKRVKKLKKLGEI
jgi:peptide deformylase